MLRSFENQLGRAEHWPCTRVGLHMCVHQQSATRVAHLCYLQSCHLKGSLWLFLFLPSFTLFGKCCLSHWESAGNEWVPLSTSGVSIWDNGTTHKARLGSGGEPLVSLTVGLWETRSKGCLCLANERLEPGVPPLWLCDNLRHPDCSTLGVEIRSGSVVLPQG